MDDLDLESTTKAAFATLDWGIPKVKQAFQNFKDKERIELILNRIIDNNYEVSMEIRELMKDNYGLYEDSWGAVLKALESYPLRCKPVIEQAIKRKWIKLNPKARCKVKIRKIDKVDDACWGFTTIRRKIPDNLKHSTIMVGETPVEIYADPSCPEGETWVEFDKLESGEYLLGVFKGNLQKV